MKKHVNFDLLALKKVLPQSLGFNMCWADSNLGKPMHYSMWAQPDPWHIHVSDRSL